MENLADFRLPWSICQSQTHTATPMNQDREIVSISSKIEVRGKPHAPDSESLTDRPDIGKNLLRTRVSMIISRRTTETKPGNHRFRPKSTKITGSGGPMGPAQTNRPGIAKVFTHTCIPNALLEVSA